MGRGCDPHSWCVIVSGYLAHHMSWRAISRVPLCGCCNPLTYIYARRTSMRPLPPRSVTSEVSTVSELPAGRSLEDAPQLAAQGPRQGREPGSASSRQERQMAEAAADLAARLAGDSDHSSAGTSREATRHGQQQLSSWVESDAERCAIAFMGR